MFQDRLDAGRRLAEKLQRYRGSPDTVILALPRGGIVVGFALHQALGLPLDVFITRKLGAPGNPEYAWGAVTETGRRFDNPDALDPRGIPSADDHLARETAGQLQEIDRRKRLYRGGRGMEDVRGRTVLVVDDGIATGSTAMAAVLGLKELGADRIVVAAPVAAPDAVLRLRKEADEVVVVFEPKPFMAVGAHYRDFAPVEDEAVAAYLRRAGRGIGA